MSGVRTVKSFCRICTAQCGILVDVEGEQVVRVRGDRDHPLTHGYTCPKGRALDRVHHHPDRIERPLMRKNGALMPVSWDECLDDIAAKLRAGIEAKGPASVGIFFGSGVGMDASGYRMAQALHAAIGTPAKFSPLTIDGTAKTLVASIVGGFPGFSPRPDYDNCKLVLFIGINPMISHGHTVAMPNPAPIIKTVAAQGEVWVIDPRRSETAGFASRHIAPKPGADYAILAYIIRDLLRDGVHRETLERNCVGVDDLRTALEPFTCAYAAELTGLRESDLDDLLASVRKAGRLAVETGTGVTMSVAGNLTVWLAWVLMIITESMNRTGGVWFHPGFLQPFDGGHLPVITEPFGPGPPSRPELRSLVGDWPCAALPDEINAGNITTFLNLGGALMRSFPDANALGEALQKLDLFVTIEIIENETTALSTHVLPTKDQLERPDVSLWDFLSPRVSTQYTPAVVAPVGERRSTWWVLSELMRRTGHTPQQALPESDRAEGADHAMLTDFMAYARCSFDDLLANNWVETDYEFPARWVDDHIAKLGGWRLAPQELLDQLKTITAEHEAEAREKNVLRLVPRRQRRHLNAALGFLGDTPDVLLSPSDAAFAGIEDGKPVRVSTARGEMVGLARVDAKMRAGAVSVPHGHRDANVNFLTSTQQVDSVTGMARYSGIPVTIEPA